MKPIETIIIHDSPNNTVEENTGRAKQLLAAAHIPYSIVGNPQRTASVPDTTQNLREALQAQVEMHPQLVSHFSQIFGPKGAEKLGALIWMCQVQGLAYALEWTQGEHSDDIGDAFEELRDMLG